MTRPFHFLAGAPSPVSGRQLAELARRAEAVGFHALVIPDHLVDQLSPVPAMATIAAATERLRIGAFVFNNDLHHPTVLAQDLASLDVLSDGRVDVGIGAGWRRVEYEAIGIPMEPGAVRVARLEEAVAILKGCFADGPFNYAGRYYHITDYDAGPAPVQRPHPPFLIGGGRRRILSLAGREAQIVGLQATAPAPGAPTTAPKRFTRAAAEQQLAWVRDAAGDRFDELELNVNPVYPDGILITDHARAEARRLADHLRHVAGIDLSEDDVIDSPYIFIGSVDALVDKLEGLRTELGITSLLTGELDDFLPVVERLAGS